jgi:hypothetical protein
MAVHGRASNGALPFLMVRLPERHRATKRQPGEEEREMKVSLKDRTHWLHGEASRVPVLWTHNIPQTLQEDDAKITGW